MAQLFYSPDLADRLPYNNTGRISQKPLRRWQLSLVKIDNKTYYLLCRRGNWFASLY